MKKLATKIRSCNKCKIAEQTDNKTVGRGSMHPRILFIGANPGREENKTGSPFVGPSGKLLDKWIEFLGLSKKDYAITNIVKCYTNNVSELNGEEVENCLPFLRAQVGLLKPEYIIPLGALPTQTLLGCKESISSLVGRIFEKNDIRYIPLFHPSYWLRRGGRGWEGSLEHVKLALSTRDEGRKSTKVDGVYEIEPLKSVKKVTDEDGFVPLHLHTTYSIGDACTKIDELVDRAKDLGMKSVAITDHGTISGLFAFQQACLAGDVKPILGCEFYVYDPGWQDKDGKKSRKRTHLVLLAKNNVGLHNLYRLDSLAATEGYFYKPRVTLEQVFEYSEGLVALSACTLGVVADLILQKQYVRATQMVQKFEEVFGDDFYLEIQPHIFPEQKVVNDGIIRIAEEEGVKLVLTNDSHYLLKSDWEAHGAIRAISFGAKLTDDIVHFSSNTHYLADAEGMRKLALKRGIPTGIIDEAIRNTLEVADKCDARIEPEKNAIPKFKAKVEGE